MSATIAPGKSSTTWASSSAATPSKPTSSTYPRRPNPRRSDLPSTGAPLPLASRRYPAVGPVLHVELRIPPTFLHASAVLDSLSLLHHQSQKVIQCLRRPTI